MEIDFHSVEELGRDDMVRVMVVHYTGKVASFCIRLVVDGVVLDVDDPLELSPIFVIVKELGFDPHTFIFNWFTNGEHDLVRELNNVIVEVKNGKLLQKH